MLTKYLPLQLLKRIRSETPEPVRAGTAGFSLLEVMIAIALLVLLAAVSLPLGSYLHRPAVRQELEKLYSMCVYLQRCALATGVAQTLTLSEKDHTYQGDGMREKLASGVRFGMVPHLLGPPAEPTTTVTAPITFVGKRITFSPQGTLQSGTVYLTDVSGQVQYALTSAVSPVPQLRRYRCEGTVPTRWTLLS